MQFLGRIVPLCHFVVVPKRKQGDSLSAGITGEELEEIA
jgi:hypothetical protein